MHVSNKLEQYFKPSTLLLQDILNMVWVVVAKTMAVSFFQTAHVAASNAKKQFEIHILLFLYISM